FLILAAFAGCGVSKIPEGETESPKTTKATTKATSDTDDADVELTMQKVLPERRSSRAKIP
ncbi:MAG: hypothetical protein IKC99_06835, partial [Clostridia bacterium]|nr:hypothetical protein [Clostridia bacterium]